MRMSRDLLAGSACLLATISLAACGEAAVGGAHPAKKRSSPAVTPGVVVSPTANASGAHGSVKEVADPQEASSFPASGAVNHAAAATPTKAGEAAVAAGAPSDAG